MTAEEYKTFCANLTVDQETRSTIADRYQRITHRLNLDFWQINSTDLHSLYVGSYGRGTAVRGFSDLDIIFVLPFGLYDQYSRYKYNGQSALLQAVRESLKKTYPTTEIDGDGQVVVIQFTDRIKFEIVPAFEMTDGSFCYPDSKNGGSWKITNPRPEINAVQENNKATKGNLINLCRMARAWRNKWNTPMGGLLIDTLANKFIINWQYNNESYSYYNCMTRDFMLYLSNQNSQQQYWLAVGSGQRVDRKGNFEYKAKQCYNLALQAIGYESANQIYSANQKWRDIYGTAYPAYPA